MNKEQKKRVIWIASMPRSGSMWTFNVGRQLLGKASFEVFPENVPQSDDEMMELARHAFTDTDPRKRWVLKVHSMIEPDIPCSAFITTFRDVRDALISWMRFMRSDFDTALNAAVDMTRICDYYAAFPEDRILHLHYSEIKQEPMIAAHRITRFLSLVIPDDEITEVVEGLTKTKVKQVIEDTEKNIQQRVENRQTISRDELVGNLDGSARGFNLTTGFQSGHVSDYKDGDWSRLLSAEQKKRMNDQLGPWLFENGYPVG